MTFEQFKEAVEVLPEPAAQHLRNTYVQAFVDENTEFYRNNILRLEDFSDGKCYTGYLWCTLKAYERLDFAEWAVRINQKEDVYVFWDIHSKDRILIPGYWRFPKNAVLLLPASVLIE